MNDKPTPLPVIPENIPVSLKQLNQWVTWRYEWNVKKSKWTKPPLNPITGYHASPTNRDHWTSFDIAFRKYQEHGFDGIGIVLTTDVQNGNSFVGFDFDHIGGNGNLPPQHQGWLNILSSYTERSPGGEGIRVITIGKLPDNQGRKVGDNEVYSTGRFLTITGHRLTEYPSEIRSCQDAIDIVYREAFPDEAKERTQEQVTENTQTASVEDEELLSRMFASANGNKIKALWEGNISGYPSASEADAALVMRLAFWTQKNLTQIDRLFRQSGLMRPKWDERHGRDTYGNFTIEKAIAKCSEVYTPSVSTKTEIWIDPLPFDDYATLPAFPLAAFPDGIGKEYIETVSRINQIDPAFTASFEHSHKKRWKNSLI